MTSNNIERITSIIYNALNNRCNLKLDVEYDFGDILEISGFKDGQWVRITIENIDPYVQED